jgi:hypothetical protein
VGVGATARIVVRDRKKPAIGPVFSRSMQSDKLTS